MLNSFQYQNCKKNILLLICNVIELTENPDMFVFVMVLEYKYGTLLSSNTLNFK